MEEIKDNILDAKDLMDDFDEPKNDDLEKEEKVFRRRFSDYDGECGFFCG